MVSTLEALERYRVPHSAAKLMTSAASQDLFGNRPWIALPSQSERRGAEGRARRAERGGESTEGVCSFRSPLFALRAPTRGLVANIPFSMTTKQLF